MQLDLYMILSAETVQLEVKMSLWFRTFQNAVKYRLLRLFLCRQFGLGVRRKLVLLKSISISLLICNHLLTSGSSLQSALTYNIE